MDFEYFTGRIGGHTCTPAFQIVHPLQGVASARSSVNEKRRRIHSPSREKIFQLEKLTKRKVSDEELSLPIVERSIASPRYADSQSSVRNEEFDTVGAYESEESYQVSVSLERRRDETIGSSFSYPPFFEREERTVVGFHRLGFNR